MGFDRSWNIESW